MPYKKGPTRLGMASCANEQGESVSKGCLSSLPTEGYIRLKRVLDIFPVSRAAWYLGVKEGRYPAPVKLGLRSAGYDVAALRKLFKNLNDINHRGSTECSANGGAV